MVGVHVFLGYTFDFCWGFVFLNGGRWFFFTHVRRVYVAVKNRLELDR